MSQIGLNSISVFDVALALNSNSTDIGNLCTSPNINKWSKFKPINHPKEKELLEDEFEGSDGDRAIGIFYGLQSKPEGGKIQDIHKIKYDYIGYPKGGINSPYRLGDFAGYDKDAKCNLYGNCIKVKVNTEKDKIPIFILYDDKNKTGVDISKLTPNNSVSDIGTYYPCIVINDNIKALKNSITNTFTPLRYNGAWYNNFYLDVNQNKADDRLPDTSQGNKQVSFLLIDKIEDSLINFKHWTNINNLIIKNWFIALPDATDLNMNFYIPKALIQTTEISNASTNQFTIFFSHTMKPEEAYKFRVEVTDGLSVYNFNLKKDANQLMLATIQHIVKWSDLNRLVMPNQEIELTVDIYLITNDGEKHQHTFTKTVKVLL